MNTSATETITTTAPVGFAKLAKHHGLAPEYLASLVLSKFCEEPAGELYIVSRQPDLTNAKSAVGDYLINRAWCEIDENMRIPLLSLLQGGNTVTL